MTQLKNLKMTVQTVVVCLNSLGTCISFQSCLVKLKNIITFACESYLLFFIIHELWAITDIENLADIF